MIFKFNIGLVFMILSLNSSYAYNSKLCKKFVVRSMQYLNPLAVFSSTTSYISSTGDCSMIGQVEYDQKVFLANNLDKIKQDIVKGGGEYLFAYSKISRCSDLGTKLFLKKSIKALRSRSILLSDDGQINNDLNNILKPNEEIKKECFI